MSISCSVWIRVAITTGSCFLAAGNDPAVTGRVIEDRTERPITGAEVRVADPSGRVVARTLSGTDGRFSIDLPGAGDYAVTASHVGHAPASPRRFTSAASGSVFVELRLSVAPVALEEITVETRRSGVLHEPTLSGAIARRQHFPAAGTRRVLLPSDLEFRGATRVADVLRWVPGSGGCTIVFLDGRVQSSMMAGVRLHGFADDVLAIEWYRRWQDAPMGLRDHPPDVREPHRCSVVALWVR